MTYLATLAIQRAIWFDEATDFTPKQWRLLTRLARRDRAQLGWFNWYVNRRRLTLSATAKELRMISNRRCL